MIEVFARRRNSPLAAGFVARLRAEGKTAREGNARYFEPLQLDPKTELVYHDGEAGAIPVRCAELGIPCELIPGAAPETAAPTETPPVGEYRVDQRGQWFSLIGPDGEKVGKSQRSEAEAWALRESVDG